MNDIRNAHAPRLRLGVSACLLGEAVRFDGGHKRDPFLTGPLTRFVEWIPVCPEHEAGLGTPREAMHLMRRDGAVRLVTRKSGRDVTDELAAFAAARVSQCASLDLDGFVLKKDSPSCGLTRVKVYSEHEMPVRTGRGLFAEALCAGLPMLPVEEEGRLCDPLIRENFIERLYAFRRVRSLLSDRPQVGELVGFHTRHKLQLLAHSPALYVELGRAVATTPAAMLERVMSEYARGFMRALTTIVSRGRHANVLQHAAGHLRRILTAAARRDLAAAIGDYQRELIPLVVPMRLIAHYVSLHGVRYLSEQVHLDPYPHELMLRNHI